jgi:hypothetical protein
LDTLDLIVPDLDALETFLTALKDLMDLTREEHMCYTKDMQVLHFHWMEMGKEWETPMILSEWYQLMERMQVPLKKTILTNLFKEQCGGTFVDTDEKKLSFAEVVVLVDAVKEQLVSHKMDPLQCLWREMVTTDPVPPVGLKKQQRSTALELSSMEEENEKEESSISAVALLSFIRSQQRNYIATLEHVTEFVHDMNYWQMTAEDNIVGGRDGGVVETMADMDRLSKRRFLSWITSDTNDLIDPYKGSVGADDMTKPLSQYWINASHDTYLANQIDSFHGKSAFAKFRDGPEDADVGMYTAALYRGVRYLEVDIWDDAMSGEPVICRRKPTTNTTTGQPPDTRLIRLSHVLRSIRCFLDTHPYIYPVILRIENHCSTPFQLKVASQLYEHLGAANLIVKPGEGESLTDNVYLPSPESARGKILILGKRPKEVNNNKNGATFINDDLDDENDGFHVLDPKYNERVAAFYGMEDDNDDNDQNDAGVVIGFDTKGPIRSMEENVLVQNPEKLLEIALADAKKAKADMDGALQLKQELMEKVEVFELRTATLTQQAGMTPEEVKRRAARAANPQGDGKDRSPEEKHPKEEGVEVHEIMPTVVEGMQDRYAEAAQLAMEAGRRVSRAFSKIKHAEQELQRAESDLQMSRQLEASGKENAARAAAEARSHQEHAEAARLRVEKVRELFRNSEEQSSSAGTVVQTALTEAKISEKRAAEAEARAKRAQATADKDRVRAEDETRKEEALEQEVNELHMKCQDAAEELKRAREKLDKANAMYERVVEQLKLIEGSSHYRDELENQGSASVSNVRHGGSLLAKHAVKLDEKDACRARLKLITEEILAAETRLHTLKREFEEKARSWKSQVTIASQSRKAADRSSHLAEELAEHAEEEREAAALRNMACEKAVEAVEHRGSQRQSVEAQLAEAERAAVEAAALAEQSRERAKRLAAESEKVHDHGLFLRAVEEKKLALRKVQTEYDVVVEEKREKDLIVAQEKRRLDTNSSVYQSAARDAASESDRLRTAQMLQQEAIVAYNTTIMLRQSLEGAITKADIAVEVAEAKKIAEKHAHEYKARRSMLVEIPQNLAKLTLLHSMKFLDWERSLSTTNICAQSIAQNVLLKMVESNPETRSNLKVYTKNHLCRVFAPWRAMQTKHFSNCDPVFAWSLGCQIVPMNFSSADENLLVAEGRFRQNGSCGYALKSSYLLENSGRTETTQTWSFNVLGAYNLPRVNKRVIRPCVRVSLYAGSTKETRIMYKTKPAKPNGLNPVWESNESYVFNVSNPSTAMVTFSVWDKFDDRSEIFVAGAAYPVSCIREGYRSIALFNSAHARTKEYAYASLLVKASKR